MRTCSVDSAPIAASSIATKLANEIATVRFFVFELLRIGQRMNDSIRSVFTRDKHNNELDFVWQSCAS